MGQFSVTIYGHTGSVLSDNQHSWLNIAECELSVLARQCLDRRIPDQASLETQVAAWTQNRNNAQAKTRWHFTTEDARTKLISLYPQID
jgi:hypothetical protein